MRQYLDAKQQYRDAILFFRMGDFYEIFYEDALVAARALELTLTSRSKDANGGGIPMCGVPFHAVDGYIARLVKQGFRVAICDQVEDPRKAKGLVKREVVRVVSPGTLTDSNYLDAREPAFLMAVAPHAAIMGVALLDLSTGEFTAAEYSGADGMQALADELAVLKPREIIVRGDAETPPMLAATGIAITPIDGMGFRCRSRAADAARSAARGRPRRLRSGSAAGCHLGCRRASALPAHHAESGSRARARHQFPPAGGCAADRSHDAAASRDCRSDPKADARDRCSTSSIAR